MKKLNRKVIWIFFFRGLLIWLIAGGYIMSMIWEARGEANVSVAGIIVGIIAGALLAWLFAWLRYYFYKYELTDDTDKAERGIIWKRYISIPYNRIQNVDIHRGILARIFGLSDLQIHTAGYGAAGARGQGSEGRLPGLSKHEAEELRDELIRRSQQIQQMPNMMQQQMMQQMQQMQQNMQNQNTDQGNSSTQ